MEISFKVTEDEFVRGARLERKASSRSSLKTALFWMEHLHHGRANGAVRLPAHQRAAGGPHPFLLRRSRPPSRDFLCRSVSRGLLPATDGTVSGDRRHIWILIVMGLVPLRLRYLYRKDPRMQGQFTIEMTSDFISTNNTAGTFSRSAWNVYECWCESKGIVVLMSHSGAWSVMSLAGLAEGQQNEVRSILTAALPRK